MHSLANDFAFALRSLRQSRGFVILTVLSIGVALGVTTTVFGVIDAALNPVLPMREPGRIVRIANYGDGATRDITWHPPYAAARRLTETFEDVAVIARDYTFLRIGKHHDRRLVVSVAPNFFVVTGIAPFLGRSFTADGSDAAAGDVAMVSFRLWRTALGGVRDLREVTVEVEGRIYRVVGVLPPYLPYSLDGGAYLPLLQGEGATGVGAAPSFVARLQAGVSATQAETTLRTVADPALTAAYGVGARPFRYRVRPVIDPRLDEMSELQRILLASAFLVLAVACANVANLMLARGVARSGEFAVRLALGARRANLVAQTLIEGLLCALGGAALGLLIATWAFHLATYEMTREVPGLGAMAASFNWRVLAFGVTTAITSGLVFAAIPAVRTSDVDLNSPLKSAAGTTTANGARRFSAIVAGEVALTMTLMLGAGLLLKAVDAMRQTDLGYNPRGLLEAYTYLPRATSKRHAEVEAGELQRILEHVRSQSWVIEASLVGVGQTPSRGPGLVSALSGGGNHRLFAQSYQVVSPTFFRTLGVPISVGRDFADGDGQVRGAVIVNHAAARVLWPSESVAGGMLKLGDLETDAPWVPVVGVAPEIRAPSTVMPETDPTPEVWVVPPPGLTAFTSLRVRVSPHRQATHAVALDAIMKQMLPPRSIVVIKSTLESFDDAVQARDFIAKMFEVLGGIALMLAAVGLYSLLSFTVARRRREFAVRRALGATTARITRMVIHDAAVMVLAGTGAGAFLAMGLAKSLDAMLYSVFYTDVGALVMAEGVLIIVALAASLVPALSAGRSDPVEMLRAT